MKLRKIKIKKINKYSILKSFYVFDTETTKLEPMPKNFVFGVIYGFNGYKVIKTVGDFKKEFLKKKYNGKILFAHNAEFDLLTIFGNILENIDPTSVFNGKFIFCNYGKLTFADSLNILLVSVEKIGEKLGIKKIENEKIKSEGLTKNNFNDDDIKYCVMDCKIVYDSLAKIFLELGVVKLTLASISLYDFRKYYLEKELYYDNLVYEFYESYYGGRTEAFYIGETKAKVYDINSLYPFSMLNIFFPDVAKLKIDKKVDLKYLMYCLNRYEGMTKIDIFHKRSYFGFLPYRFEGRLLFPNGYFTTTVNFNELRFALENDIIEIKKVHYIISGNPIKSIFNKFVIDNFKKRFDSKNDFDSYFYKIKLNSLYGRFAMRKKFINEYYNQIPFEIIAELQKSNKFYELKTFSKDRDDCYLITKNEKIENSFFSIPVFSSYITSQARITLLKSLLKNEQNDVLYCDTDCLFLTGDFIGKISEKLGDWKKEEKEILEINGLKNYLYKDLKTGENFEAIKGISKKAIKLGKQRYMIKKYYKTKEALRRNKEAGESFEMIKELTHKYNKRILLSNGKTLPLQLEA